jgi:HEAT repeat protein
MLRMTALCGAFFVTYGLAFQNGPPSQSGGAQGAFFSSGAPANTADKQGAFTSSGAPADTAGPQWPVGGTPTDPSFAPLLADPEAKLAAIAGAAGAGNLPAVRLYLKDTDPVIEQAAFEALLANDANSAVQDLLSIIRDTGQLTRRQSLAILASSPGVDEGTIVAVLRNSAGDQDPLVRQYAIEALAFRDADAASRNGPAGSSQQGPFTSSGGAANIAGPQGSFMSSGAVADIGGPQPNLPRETPLAWTLEITETKLTAVNEAAQGGNREALRTYVRDSDPAIQRAAFDALFAHDDATAIQDLLTIIRDSTQMTRIQALVLLNTAPQVDDLTVLTALRSAASDADPVVRAYAIQALAVMNARGQ